MTYDEFSVERQEARYAVGKGRFRGAVELNETKQQCVARGAVCAGKRSIVMERETLHCLLRDMSLSRPFEE